MTANAPKRSPTVGAATGGVGRSPEDSPEDHPRPMWLSEAGTSRYRRKLRVDGAIDLFIVHNAPANGMAVPWPMRIQAGSNASWLQ